MNVSKKMIFLSFKFKINMPYFLISKRNITYHYIQGQTTDNKTREYFYFVDHQGMLYLDDSKIKNFTSCIKEKKFLAFFFSRLNINRTSRYLQFPYISLCGREINYVRCDDLPVVFTHIAEKFIYYNHAGELLKETFVPQKVRMNIENGRVYHPAADRVGGLGLVKSSLAIELSNKFRFENGENKGPTHIVWNNNSYALES